MLRKLLTDAWDHVLWRGLVGALRPFVRRRNVLLFGSNHAWGCNALALLNAAPDAVAWDCVWVLRCPSAVPARGRVVRYGSLGHLLAVASSQMAFVTHSRRDVAPYLPSDSHLVNLWHGVPLKRIGKHSTTEMTRWRARRGLAELSRITGTFVAGGVGVAELMSSAMSIPAARVLPFGQPRLDDVCKLRSKTELSSLKEVLYAPTFRDSGQDAKVLDLFLQSWFALPDAGEYRLRIRLHPRASVSPAVASEFTRMKLEFVDAAESPEQSLATALAVITDYSSIAFDALACDIPVAIFAPDVEEYMALRGPLYAETNAYLSLAQDWTTTDSVSTTIRSTPINSRLDIEEINRRGAQERLWSWIESFCGWGKRS